jgi:hypothetical protein
MRNDNRQAGPRALPGGLSDSLRRRLQGSHKLTVQLNALVKEVTAAGHRKM